MVDQAAEDDLVLVEDDAAAHGVDDGLGLLEDLLLHERVKLALHDLVQLELDAVDRPRAVIRLVLLLAPMQGQTAIANGGNIIVLEINDPIRVLDNGTGIRCKKVLNIGLLSS